MVLRTLSDDVMEGRGPGSVGDERSRAYLSAVLREGGLEPGGPSQSWEQAFEIVGISGEVPLTWSFTAPDRRGSTSLEFKRDFVAVAGAQHDEVSLDRAELVFVGYGIQAPEYRWDDYKGMDLRGKVLVMLNNDPDWDPELFGGETRLYYGRWTYKYEIAARAGRGWRDHHPHRRFGGLPLAGGADLLDRRAVRAAATRASRGSRCAAGSPRRRRAI